MSKCINSAVRLINSLILWVTTPLVSTPFVSAGNHGMLERSGILVEPKGVEGRQGAEGRYGVETKDAENPKVEKPKD